MIIDRHRPSSAATIQNDYKPCAIRSSVAVEKLTVANMTKQSLGAAFPFFTQIGTGPITLAARDRFHSCTKKDDGTGSMMHDSPSIRLPLPRKVSAILV